MGENNRRFIAAVAGSAGSLPAIEQFFSQAPHDDVSYVVVQHLPASFRSQLGVLLKKYTDLRIVEIYSGTHIEKDCIYITPPDSYLTIDDDTFYLSPRLDGLNRSIDIFLSSLARNSGDKAIAVLLSGTGTDGVKGLAEVRRANGLTLAQIPESGQFAALPENAIRSGNVDKVLDCKDMAGFINRHVEQKKQKNDRKAI
jgi:two-component system CheB/CheR fusion protein